MSNNRIKRSVIWKMPSDEFRKLISESKTYANILNTFGLINKGGNNRTLKKRLIEENIDFSHINLHQGRKFSHVSMSREECLLNIFSKDCKKDRSSARKYLIKYNLIPYKCECGLKKEWKNKKLSLQLDHKDGNGDNNTLENLRWLCPNCHSQTANFAGKSCSSNPCRPANILHKLIIYGQ